MAEFDPRRHIVNGHFMLPPEYDYLRNLNQDAVITELLISLQALQQRVEELERWLPLPPEEEDF